MSRPKASLSLPTITKEVGNGRSAKSFPKLVLPTVQELVARQSIKKISLWFRTWRTWQQRIFVCRIMEQCSRYQLHILATALEPVLHIDFSSSLVPHLASLHVDGAATFQVQRGMLQQMISSNLVDPEHSVAYLPSLPTTLLTSESASHTSCNKATTHDNDDVAHIDAAGKCMKKKEERVMLPSVLPLTHSKHALISPESSLEDVQALRHTRFSSVPDFQSTTNLLRCVKHKELLRPRHHNRSHSLNMYLHSKSNMGCNWRKHQAEQFKTQLAAVSQMMLELPTKQQSQLLLEIVKLCSKDMLAYLVQCLYQRLRDHTGIDTLPDSLLLEIFSYLDPKSLCRCAQVCQRWHHISDTGWLWEQHCSKLGREEGVGDLVKAVRSVCEQQGGGAVDWKLAYRELNNVIWRIRKLVLKTAAEQEEAELEQSARKAATKLTKFALRATLSLREMIDLVRSRSGTQLCSVQEVLHSTPESAALIRRRNRKERKDVEAERLREESERALSTRYQHRRPYDRSTPTSRLEGLIYEGDESLRSVHHPHKSTTPDIIELIREALDHRSGFFYLPDPDGVRCLVLAGCLMADQPHRPGKIQPIPRLRRLLPLYSTVLCLQCDQRKIVCGTQSRDIQVYDIRSGRHINTFNGHKGSVQCLQFDDNKLVSGSWDTTCIVWDVVKGSEIHKLLGHTECVSSLKFDEIRLITGSHDKSIRVWSTSTWECTTVIGNAHAGPVTCVTLNGSVIASGAADKCVKVWSLATYKPLASLPHSGSLTSLLVSNLLLVTACQSSTVQLWSMEGFCTQPSNVKRAVSYPEDESPRPFPITHWQLENELYFTDMLLDGDKIFACGSNCLIYEWDIATGMFTRSLTGHSRPLTCVGITQNKLVSASEDHTVCIWYYKKKKYMSKAEAELLMEESNPGFPDIPIRVITD